MGVYDILPGNHQIKCWWSEMRNIPYGCKVPPVCGESTYSIALEKGGFANVIDCQFTNITDKPSAKKMFDKWGNSIEKIPDEYLLKSGK